MSTDNLGEHGFDAVRFRIRVGSMRQRRFRETYAETFINFQNNMKYLSPYADEVKTMLTTFQEDRQKI